MNYFVSIRTVLILSDFSMKRQRIFYKSRQKENEINLSPLIDLIFILLIFFIVTAAIVNETGLTTSTPDLLKSKIEEKRKPVLITLHQNGSFSFGGKKLSIYSAESLIKAKIMNNQKHIIIEAEDQSSSSLAIQLMDIAYFSGAEDVKLKAK